MEGDRSLRTVIRHPLENKRTIALALLWAAVGLLLSISLVSFVLWQRDLHEIRTIVQGKIDASKTPNEIVLDARRFFARPLSRMLLGAQWGWRQASIDGAIVVLAVVACSAVSFQSGGGCSCRVGLGMPAMRASKLSETACS